MHPCIHACMNACACIYIYRYRYLHIYIYTTHIHTNMHTTDWHGPPATAAPPVLQSLRLLGRQPWLHDVVPGAVAPEQRLRARASMGLTRASLYRYTHVHIFNGLAHIHVQVYKCMYVCTYTCREDNTCTDTHAKVEDVSIMKTFVHICKGLCSDLHCTLWIHGRFLWGGDVKLVAQNLDNDRIGSV